MLINVAVNQNGFVNMFIDNPIRCGNKWKSKYLYVNSIIYKKVKAFVDETAMSWESEYISIPV